MFAWLEKHNDASTFLQRAKLYRQAGQPIHAFWQLTRNAFVGRRLTTMAHEVIESRLELIECILDFVEAVQHWSIFRTKLLRWPLGKIIDLMSSTNSGFAATTISVALEGKIQIVHLRRLALVEDADSEYWEKLWLLLDEQVSYPEL